jgi:hypothetical protein
VLLVGSSGRVQICNPVCTAHTVPPIGPCTRSVCRPRTSCTLTSCVLPRHTSGRAPQPTAIFSAKDTSSCAQHSPQPPGCQDRQRLCPSPVMTSSETRWKNCTEILVHCWQTATSCEYSCTAVGRSCGLQWTANGGREYLSGLSAC